MFAHLLIERTWLWCLHTAAAHSGVGVLSSLDSSSAHIRGVSPVDWGKGRATLSQWQLFLTPLNLSFIIDIFGGVFFPNSDVPASPTWFQYWDIHHVVYEFCLKTLTETLCPGVQVWPQQLCLKRGSGHVTSRFRLLPSHRQRRQNQGCHVISYTFSGQIFGPWDRWYSGRHASG